MLRIGLALEAWGIFFLCLSMVPWWSSSLAFSFYTDWLGLLNTGPSLIDVKSRCPGWFQETLCKALLFQAFVTHLYEFINFGLSICWVLYAVWDLIRLIQEGILVDFCLFVFELHETDVLGVIAFLIRAWFNNMVEIPAKGIEGLR